MEALFNEPTAMGIVTGEQLEALQKALLAPESTTDLYETSGGNVTHQSLEGMLASLTLTESDYTFYNDVNKLKAYSTVEEYPRYVGMGISDGGFVNQMENPEFTDPDIDKPIAIMKYLSEGWQVGDVATATRTVVDFKADAQRFAMGRLLRNLNMRFYNGNSVNVPEEFDGLEKVISEQSSDNIRDLRGGNVSQTVFNLVAQLIEENNGTVANAKIYTSPAGRQNIHEIIAGERAGTIQNFYSNSGDANMTIGGQINYIETPFGRIICRTDKLLGLAYEARGVPVKYNKGTGSTEESATSSQAPSKPSGAAAVVAPTVTGSLFTAGTTRPSGTNQRYKIVARNKWGRSIASDVIETSSPVAALGAVDITITPNQNDGGSKLPTCFEILGEKVYNSGEFRLLTVVPASAPPLSNVVYQDKNIYIPGTARMFVVDQTIAGPKRVTGLAQLLPIHNTDIGRRGRFIEGLINYYCVPKYYRPNVLVEIRNVNVEQTSANIFNII
jgi:hypothetical protein